MIHLSELRVKSQSAVTPSKQAPHPREVTEAADISEAAAQCELRKSHHWIRQLLGASLQNQLSAAFHWQFWCWGRDVVAIPQNGLLRMHFERCPPPEGAEKTSCYRRQETNSFGQEYRIALSGDSLFFAVNREPGIHLRRYHMAPCLHECALFPRMMWSSARSIPIAAPRDHAERQLALRSIAELCCWIARYESHIEKLVGISHRINCQTNWKKLPPADPNKLQQLWTTYSILLAEHCSMTC